MRDHDYSDAAPVPPSAFPALARRRVVQEVLRVARGHWPATYADWCEAAVTAGCTVRVSPPRPGFSALLLDDLILIAPHPDPRVLCRRVAHELAEYLTQTDVGGPEMRVPANTTPHGLACDMEDAAVFGAE